MNSWEDRVKNLSLQDASTRAGVRGGAIAGIGIRAGVQAVSKGSSLGVGVRAAGMASKGAAAPVAAGLMAIDAANLAVNKKARVEAKDHVGKMERDPWYKRVAKAALDPVNTIYGAGANAVDAVHSMSDAKMASDSYAAAKKLFDERQAKKNLQQVTTL